VHPQIEIDPALFRPNEDTPSYDTARIRAHVGWQPEIPLRQTLAAIYADVVAQRRAGA
jgi:nucleoside-diphosphate-sugar epimerase